MARKDPETDYATSLDQVRDVYITLEPKRRLRIIDQRLGFKDSSPNNLVNAVSAVEGFARALLIKMVENDRVSSADAYKKYRYTKPSTLIAKIMEQAGVEDIALYFGEDNWELFKFAVDYRNLVVHDCTYVSQGKALPMISACHELLIKLTQMAGIKDYEPPF